MAEVIPFEVANRAVSHLGRHLYGSTPPALAELIANAYDAYAKRVWIQHQELDGNGRGRIVVGDSGLGMDVEALKAHYAKIGQRKLPTEAPEGMQERKPMGKKGIGKLAAFSIGDSYTVYTKTASEGSWKKLRLVYGELIDAQGPYNVSCEMVSLDTELLCGEDLPVSGTIVVIDDLRRNWTKGTEKSLMTRIARRFYLASRKVEFSLAVNGEEVNLASNAYYGKLDIVLHFGFAEGELDEVLGSSETRTDKELLSLSTLGESESLRCNKMVFENGVKGWLGFVNHPKDLFENDDENFSNVAVYINGKISDDDFLRNHPDSTFASKYMVGEVEADYLGLIDDPDEVVTSSRQGMDYDNERVSSLLEFILMVRTKAISLWNEIHARKAIDALPSYITSDSGYVEWSKSLDPEAQKFNNGILRCVQALLDNGYSDERDQEASVKALVNGSIEMVELVNKNKLLSSVSEALGRGDTRVAFASLIELLGKINASEAYSALRIAKERIAALNTLESLVGTGAKEKEFQAVVGKNPWLINGSWKPMPTEVVETSFKAQREAFYAIANHESNNKRNFIDLLVAIRDEDSEQLVIVEMKRDKATDYSTPNAVEVIDQINRYRRAIRDADPNRFESFGWKKITDIPALFIFTKNSGPEGSASKYIFADEDIDLIRSQKIVLLPYDKMIADCRRRLYDEIELVKSFERKPHFSANGSEVGCDNGE